MNRRTMEDLLKNLDQRVGRIEQILPTLATKDDLANFATKDDLANFATKDDLANFVTRDEFMAECERTRAHFDAVSERLESQIRLLAEGLLALTRRFEEFQAETRAEFARMDRRLTRLEAQAQRASG